MAVKALGEEELRSWMAELLSKSEFKGHEDFLDKDKDFRLLLRSGEALCHLFNTIVKQKHIRTIHSSNLPFKKIENISSYINACSNLENFNQANIYEPMDLYERVNMDPILRNLTRLKQIAQENTNLSSLLNQQSASPSPRNSPIRNFSPSIRTQRPQTLPPNSSLGMNAPSVASLQDDIKTKKEFKFSRKLETLALEWLLDFFRHYRSKLSRPYPIIDEVNTTLHSLLQSGELLCELANILHTMMFGSNIILKINHSRIAFLCMENIGFYVKSAHLFGVQSSDIFEAPDLFEKKNMNTVITHFHVLATHIGKTVEGYDGPIMENTSQVKTLWSQSLTHSEIDSEPNEQTKESLTKEQTELLEWVNQKLKLNGSREPITSIGPSMRSGEVLIDLLCILTQQNDIKERAEMNPTTLWHHMQNSSLVLKFIAQQTFHQFEDCTAQDIVLGDTERICCLLAFLRDKFDLDFLFIRMMNEGLDDPSKAISYKDLEYDITVDTSPSPISRKRRKKKKSEGKRRSSVHSLSPIDPSKERKSRRESKSKSPSKRKSSSRRERSSRVNGETSKSTKHKDKHVRRNSTEKTRRISADSVQPPSLRGSVLLRQQSVQLKVLEKARIEKAQLAVRQRIVQELFDTEQRYVEGLEILVSQLVLPLRESAVLSADDFTSVFSNVTELLASHQSLLHVLKQSIDTYTNTSPVAEVFFKERKFIQNYSDYLSNYSCAIVYLYYLKQRNEQFNTMLSNWESLPEVTLSSVSSYLVMPVQRLPRYILLFKDMMKYTPDEHCDAEVFPRLVNYIQKILNRINKGIDKEKADENSKLLSVVESIDGAEVVVLPNRRVIMEGRLRFKQKGKPLHHIRKKKSQIFLFNDYIVVCDQYEQPKGSKQFECKFHTSLRDLCRDDIIIDEDSISIRCEESFSLKPLTADEKSSWAKAFHSIST